jgi:hypothetical protein
MFARTTPGDRSPALPAARRKDFFEETAHASHSSRDVAHAHGRAMKALVGAAAVVLLATVAAAAEPAISLPNEFCQDVSRPPASLKHRLLVKRPPMPRLAASVRPVKALPKKKPPRECRVVEGRGGGPGLAGGSAPGRGAGDAGRGGGGSGSTASYSGRADAASIGGGTASFSGGASSGAYPYGGAGSASLVPGGIAPAPGPIAGAGLPALLVGLIYWFLRRRTRL